jgi:sulfide:quinone oxidoreductase
MARRSCGSRRAAVVDDPEGEPMRIVILGAGVSGHTAALILRRKLPKAHEVVVVTPNRRWNWIPSNIWVGAGVMAPEQVTFELRPVYDKVGVRLIQAKATALHPEGGAAHERPYVELESTAEGSAGTVETLEYDYLINATGPKLNFGATPGLGPDGHTLSVCTAGHAADAARALEGVIAKLKAGERQTLVIGTGHGTCTCQGAAFEYAFNVEFELRRHGVRERARVVYLTNEAELGDFGVGGMHLEVGGYITQSKTFAESLFAERGVEWITGAHTRRIDPNRLEYETLDGQTATLDFDFAMLIPPFTGVGLRAFDRAGEDISASLFAPNGFMKVDADYSGKAFDDWRPEDWPETYQTRYPNVFAVGIAFAPPHPISRPRTSKNGVNITPAPPRTGMPSAIMGRAVAHTIVDMITRGATAPTHGASMARLGAACVASAGASHLRGSAVSMTMYPVVPDFRKYPNGGRDLTHTTGEIGLAGHWIKQLLHHAFIYKAKARPLWWIIPE